MLSRTSIKLAKLFGNERAAKILLEEALELQDMKFEWKDFK